MIVKCEYCQHTFDINSVKEAGMGYVKCPKCHYVVTPKNKNTK
jgi:hypothetical protein